MAAPVSRARPRTPQPANPANLPQLPHGEDVSRPPEVVAPNRAHLDLRSRQATERSQKAEVAVKEPG
jgi:hypothetical protein